MIKNKNLLLSQILSIIILSLSLFTPNLALAEIGYTGGYTGMQFSNSNYKLKYNSGDKDEGSWGHVKANLGLLLNENFSLEGQFGLTTNSDSNDGIVTAGAYLKIGSDFGAYRPYGLIGFSTMGVYQDGQDNITESGGSLGLGIDIFGSKNLAITIEYLRLIDKSVDNGDLTFDIVGLGFTYYFTGDLSRFNKNRDKLLSPREF